MKQVLEGSHAVSEGVKLARAQVISAYPITPQTHIVEKLSEIIESGALDARFIRVESEHSAMAAVIGSATAGVRSFTATSSQGLALMHELLHWASGARLPIVMAEVNRALAPGWNIWTDQTDSLAQRDTGWIQLYCEDAQEVIDTTIQAFRLAETVYLPVMVILDAFFLSHTYEPVDVPEQDQVDRFLPPYQPRFRLDTQNPCAFNQLAPPNMYMELRYNLQQAMEQTFTIFADLEADFQQRFGRRYGAVEAIACDDAEVVLVTSGTVTSTSRQVIQDLRAQGEKVGLVKIKMFRPFPTEALLPHLLGARKIAVIDRNYSFGAGGIFAQELQAVLCNVPAHPPVFDFIAGLGGRDVTTAVIEDIYRRTLALATPPPRPIWIGVDEQLAATGS